MKRTLLALALMLATTGLFAQVGMQKLDMQMQKKAVSQMERQTVKVKKNVNRTAKDGERTLLCDFSTATDYTFGTNAAHTVAGWGWNLQADTNSYFGLQGDYLNYWLLGVTEENPAGDGWWIFDPSRGYENPTWDNGFAYLDLLTIEQQGLQTGVMDAYVQFNQPIDATELSGVDIYFNTAMQRFNSERYFIEWSNTPDFTTYDSLEFFVRGLEINSNEAAIGAKRLTLPKNTPNASSAGNLVYLRFRYTSPANEPGGQPHSYFWFIDDVNYQEAPEHRLDIVKCQYQLGGYHNLPSVITPDTLIYAVDIENTGGTDYNDAVLQNTIYSIQFAETEDGENTYTQVAVNLSAGDTLRNTTQTIVESQNGADVVYAARRNVTLMAGSTHLPSGTPGTYAVASFVNASAMETPIALDDTVYFNVVEPSADLNGSYRWSRDRNVLIERWGNFKYGFMQSGGATYLTDEAAWNRAGYEVCIPFTADNTDRDLYINGVEVVPALDSCAPGAQFIGKLRKIDWEGFEASDYNPDALVTEVMDAWDVPVESEVYTLQSSDLNNGLCTDPDYLDVLTPDEFRSIYLPFKNSVELVPGETYYACYRMVSNGRFMIAADDPRALGTFGPGTNYYASLMLVFTPGIPSSVNYAWGGRFYFPDYCDGKTPLIHMVIGDASTRSLSEEIAVATSLNAYPNPATDNATISYSLKKAGNVSIVITDLMGRVVMNMEEGNQNAGVNYTVNVNTANLANGTYFYTLNVNGEKQTKKFVVSK
ncbi:MAG: T9SS type A sorting domain-containing protein [Bacteroidales bacterium]|nr:T9SS type A sorting domain-containing protein [Bacteroidales bacterium]